MNKLEKEIEAKLKAELENLGCLVLKFVSPGNAGVPDRLVLLPGGVVFFVELKNERGRLAPLQRAWRERLRRQGCLYALVRSEADAAKFVQEVGETVELSRLKKPLAAVLRRIAEGADV